jgi:hypothetical protein
MPTREPTSEALVDYMVQAILRAREVYTGRGQDEPMYALALGETVALFNLADEFGLIGEVRRQVDQQAGRDVYGGLSEAMKAYYLGVDARPAGPGARGQSVRSQPRTPNPVPPHRPRGPRPPQPPRIARRRPPA